MNYINYNDIEKMIMKCKCSDILPRKNINYYNIACAFDVETSSFYDNGNKIGIMYEWTFGIDNIIIYGRKWCEFTYLMENISNGLSLNNELRLICYVHNLSFEFQFMSKRYSWINVFSVKERKVLFAVNQFYIEFRCSWLLSGYSLENVAKIYTNLEKLIGDLDYSKIRHCDTPMDNKELSYCEYDIKIILEYIKSKIQKGETINKIPLTKTGYVRELTKFNCLYGNKSHKKSQQYIEYHKLMKSLPLSVEEYRLLKQAFQGGFTHGNAFHNDKILSNVFSYDFTSSYPAVMCSEKFPMSKGEKIENVSRETFIHSLDKCCCLFEITYHNIFPKNFNDNIISFSKCRNVKNPIINNGRIFSADEITMTLTEIDFKNIELFYTYSDYEINIFYRYVKLYLPKNFIKTILYLYDNKTELKNVNGKEDEYLNIKEMLNACYGMTVTDIFKDDYTFNNTEWILNNKDLEKEIEKYNKSKTRFLSFFWGIWVTAYARQNLFSAISQFQDNDYIYSDTDSVKFLNEYKYINYFENYNIQITEKIKQCLKSVDIEYKIPKTIKGIEKPLGVWDKEHPYNKFKFLGAKRYMFIDDENKLSLTVSGLNKRVTVPYLQHKYKNDIEVMENFTDGLYIPPSYTGKMTHTYIDFPVNGKVVDYLGNESEYFEFSCVHLENADYTLNISDEYEIFIKGLESIKV